MKINAQFIKAVKRLASIRDVDPIDIARKLGMSDLEWNTISRMDYKVPDIYVNKLVEEYHVNPEFLYFPDRDVPIIATYHSPALKDVRRSLKGPKVPEL